MKPNPAVRKIGSDRKQKLTQEAGAAGRFLIVGLLATATHAAVALLALEGLGLGPYLSNIIGFVTAFALSFTGHHFWSFAHTREAGQTRSRMIRFLVVALAGFALNSGVLTGWLQLTDWPRSIGLLFSIAVVPVLSFLSARLWAFRTPPDTSKICEE